MNILLSVWTNMRAASREMIDNRSVAFAILLYAIGGIGSMMMGLLDTEIDIPVTVLLVICLIVGPIVVILLQFVVAGVVLLFGRLFKGTAKYMELYKALSIGYIPFIVLIPFYTIWLASDPDSLLFSDIEPTGVIPTITMLLTLVMSIYSFIIQIVATSEAHQFSKWKAFFTIFIPGILLFVILLVIILAIAAFIVGLTAL